MPYILDLFFKKIMILVHISEFEYTVNCNVLFGVDFAFTGHHVHVEIIASYSRRRVDALKWNGDGDYDLDHYSF